MGARLDDGLLEILMNLTSYDQRSSITLRLIGGYIMFVVSIFMLLAMITIWTIYLVFHAYRKNLRYKPVLYICKLQPIVPTKALLFVPEFQTNVITQPTLRKISRIPEMRK